MKQNKKRSELYALTVVVALVAIAIYLFGGWPRAQASAPGGARDQILSDARYVVRDYRDADAILYQYDDQAIQDMLLNRQIIMLRPRCENGMPWADTRQILIRYSCEGPLP